MNPILKLRLPRSYYPTTHSPSPISQATNPGCKEILEMTVAWHQGHLTRQGSGPSWLIATNCASATEKSDEGVRSYKGGQTPDTQTNVLYY